MGTGETIDDAIGEFAYRYADPAKRDHRALVTAVQEMHIEAGIEA